MFREAKEKIIEAGKKMMGTDSASEFEKEALAYEKRYGAAPEAAKKKIFMDYLNLLDGEISLSGCVDSDSDILKKFAGGLETIFDKKDLENFKVDSSSAHFRSLPITPLSGRDAGNMEFYYKSKFGGEVPSSSVIRESAENTKIIQGLIRRFRSDPGIMMSGDLERSLLLRRDLGADIGKILLAKENLRMHEHNFGKEIDFEKAMDELNKETRKSGKNMVVDTPGKFFKKVGKNLSPNFNSAKNVFSASVKATGEELWAGTKIAAKAGKAAARYIDKKL